MIRRVLREPAARVSVVILVGIAVLVAFGGLLAPQEPLGLHPEMKLQGPSAAHLLGTDYVGRDVLSRLLSGSRVSVLGALIAVAVALVLGATSGIASAWFGRRTEWVALRVTDTLMVLPFVVFAIAVAGTLGNGLTQSMVAVGVLMSPLYFRVTRAVTLGLRSQQYVEAAELMGASQWWVVRRHIWAKVMPTIAVTTAQALGTALLLMASLTFLGLGVEPPAPTWGGMLASDLAYLTQQPWAPVYPGVLIMLTVGALNLLADVIRDSSPDGVRRTWRQNVKAARGSRLTLAASAVAVPTTTEEVRDERVPA